MDTDYKPQALTNKKPIILDAAISIIEREGTDALSHRKVAQQAGVSPGTITYHYNSLEELTLAALNKSSTCLYRTYRQLFKSVRSTPEAIHVIADIMTSTTSLSKNHSLLIQCYVFATGKPQHFSIIQPWIGLKIEFLLKHFSYTAAVAIEALITASVARSARKQKFIDYREAVELLTKISHFQKCTIPHSAPCNRVNQAKIRKRHHLY